MATNDLIVGQLGKAAEGTVVVSRALYDGAQISTAAHGDYLSAALAKRVYLASTQAGQTTTVGAATTYVGIVLSNPIGNLFNLSVLQIAATEVAVPAAVNGFFYGIGYNGVTQVTHTTPLTPASTFVGVGPTPTGKVDSSATLPTAPTFAGVLGSTASATTNPGLLFAEVRGALVVPPGGYVMTLTSVASQTTSFWGSILWEEIPI